MTYTLKAALAAAIVIGCSGAASADGDFAISGGIGTMGGTIEGQFQVNDYVQLRAGANYLTFEESIDVDDISYDGDLDFSGLGAFVDVHPFGGSFFITGGAYAGGKDIDLVASSDVAVDIGGVTFTPAEYGRLEGDVSFDDVAPFLGLGFDTTFEGSGNWGFNLMAGAALFGSGDVTLEAVGGTLSNDPVVQTALAQEIQDIESEIEDYELWPVVQVGLSYRF
ncbi:MAG: hypothetical protein NXH72_02095 [Hyphomonadaceae bacterium]|nr:hypothetical protein [Hyphomonadaceae bacterium]